MYLVQEARKSTDVAVSRERFSGQASWFPNKVTTTSIVQLHQRLSDKSTCESGYVSLRCYSVLSMNNMLVRRSDWLDTCDQSALSIG